MTQPFDGKVAVVTGAAGGIGSASATRLAKGGASIVAVDVDRKGLEGLASSLGEFTSEVLTVTADLSAIDAIADLIAQTMDRFGGIDLLHNNAGIIAGTSIDLITESQWDEVLAVNAKSQLFLIKAVLPSMRARGGGSILNMSSIGGYLGFANMPIYSASKAAVIGFTRSLAVDLSGDNIRVNAICPGTIDTAMPKAFLADIPSESRAEVEATFFARQLMKRYGSPDEISEVVCFLLSESSSFLTGAVIPVDGGWNAW